MVHLMGLTGLMRLTRAHIRHFRTPWLYLDRLLVPLTMVLGVFAVHVLEVAAYALLYRRLEVAPDWETALELSAGAYSTAGWTGIALPQAWRVLPAFEALNGMLLLGWSTAFLFQTLHRILETEDTHPLPEGAIAEEIKEEVEEELEKLEEKASSQAGAGSADPSPRPKRSGKGAP